MSPESSGLGARLADGAGRRAGMMREVTRTTGREGLSFPFPLPATFSLPTVLFRFEITDYFDVIC